VIIGLIHQPVDVSSICLFLTVRNFPNAFIKAGDLRHFVTGSRGGIFENRRLAGRVALPQICRADVSAATAKLATRRSS
jgi:hypothetical protein